MTKVNNAENLSCAPAYYNDEFPNETSINSILNPEANCFLPLYRGSTARINPLYRGVLLRLIHYIEGVLLRLMLVIRLMI